ncbi:MAG: hypothetical protein ACREBC_30980 [Pyrinomonadaceae bacterium]
MPYKDPADQRACWNRWKERNPEICRTQALRSSKTYAQKRREWLNQHKLSRGCEICGIDGPAYMLDMHHRIADTKQFNIGSRCHGVPMEALQAEAEKCVVLCANCHRQVTHGDLVLPETKE